MVKPSTHAKVESLGVPQSSMLAARVVAIVSYPERAEVKEPLSHRDRPDRVVPEQCQASFRSTRPCVSRAHRGREPFFWLSRCWVVAIAAAATSAATITIERRMTLPS